jgi:hypothetical protein
MPETVSLQLVSMYVSVSLKPVMQEQVAPVSNRALTA